MKNIEIEDVRKNHITLRKIYINSVKDKTLKKIFRPGNRLCPEEKCYFKNQKIFVKFLDIQGSDKYNIEPVHLNIKFPVVVKNVYVKKIINLKISDFKNSGPNIKNKNNLRFELANIYNLSYDEVFDDNFEVTISEFEYLQ